MVDPISITVIIKLALAKLMAAQGPVLLATAVVVALLTFREITNWFTDRKALMGSDKDNIAFTLQQKLATGEYKTVQGIFNKRTQAIPDARTITSKRIDAELASVHATHELALYS